MGLQRQLQQLNTAQSNAEKEITAAQARRDAITRDIDVTSGQMAAYAQMLVSAEGSRRTPEMPEIPDDEKTAGDIAREYGTPEKKHLENKKAGGGNGKMQNPAVAEDKTPKGKVTKLKPKAKPEAQA
jgi:hypothetical protein